MTRFLIGSFFHHERGIELRVYYDTDKQEYEIVEVQTEETETSAPMKKGT